MGLNHSVNLVRLLQVQPVPSIFDDHVVRVVVTLLKLEHDGLNAPVGRSRELEDFRPGRGLHVGKLELVGENGGQE